MTFSEAKAVFTTIGAAGVVIVSAASLFAKEQSGRVAMGSASGTIGNSNDLASHLIFVLPFILYIAMDRRRAFLIRVSMFVPAAYALRTILGTASRGALIALAGAFLFTVLWAPAKQRVAAIAIALLLGISAPIFLRGNAASRLESLFGGQHEEAQESEDSRSYLLKQSLIYTIQHPIAGIGLGQFPNYEGQQSINAGKVGNWHETHNSFTQVSSECGLPALVFFVLGIGGAFLSVNRTYRKARREGYPEIVNACFCYLLSMVGFMISITFLANAFRFYLPLMIGLSIALTATAKREMSLPPNHLRQPEPTGWAVAVPVSTRTRMARL
jgi:O-antigen ligase